jgi:dTDP-glucose pyrophosphorylase
MISNNRQKFSSKWEKCFVNKSLTLKEALIHITESGTLIACVVDDFSKKLIGILTDSDIRKALLNGASLDEKIFNHLNLNPLIASEEMTALELSDLAHRTSKREIPLVNKNNEVVDIFVLGVHDQKFYDSQGNDIYTNYKKIDNYMFILAGGLGSRLQTVVNDRPKSLALIGGKPIIETIIKNAEKQGFQNFFISTNYLAQQVENFLSQARFSHLNIEFIRENIQLGTAGSIGIVKDKINNPILVCNSDILTLVNFHKIISNHNESKADITCVVRPYQLTVPYGVVEVRNSLIYNINEKPKLDFVVNAGIYVLSSEICKHIDPSKYLDMPNFISKMMKIKKNILPYMLYEYWIDVGKPEDYYKANDEYHLYFGN